MYQRRLRLSMPLEKMCFRMQAETAAYIRALARESGLSQSAVFNAIILDFALRQTTPGEIEKSPTLVNARDYTARLVACLPKNSLTRLLRFCQDHIPDKL